MSEVRCQTEEEAADYCVELYQQKVLLLSIPSLQGLFSLILTNS